MVARRARQHFGPRSSADADVDSYTFSSPIAGLRLSSSARDWSHLMLQACAELVGSEGGVVSGVFNLRSTCERLTVGGRLPKHPSVSQLISRPDSVLSKCRRLLHPNGTLQGRGWRTIVERGNVDKHRYGM